jgi:HSP20 family protein
MNIILRRNPAEVVRYPSLFHSPLSMIEELNELSGKFWEAWPEMTGGDIVPRTEMYEDNGNLIVKTEMPGINKEDVDISLEGDILTLKAEKKEEEVTEEADYYAREVRYGNYSRSVKLPFRINNEKIEATLENGVLELKLPKAEEAKPKKIEVKSQLPETEHKEPKKRAKRATKKTEK